MSLKHVYLLFFLFLAGSISAQLPSSAFSFNAKKNISIPCGQNCTSIVVKVPAIDGSPDQYTVNKTDSFVPNTLPGNAGTSVGSLDQDDRYTPTIPLPFIFPFFENIYDQLIISTNGIVSFDIARASTSAPWAISGLDASLPSTDYDRAIIMGVFHDIDISRPESPNRQIKYEIVGEAPHRKLVISYYKVPCFDCNSLVNNTYQITLYEGLGIVEVHVFERQVCNTWNEGAAMIGLQNYNRDKGIMAPGRSAFTTPRWNGVPMNEAWRFAPAGGSSLLKKVELYTTAGELVATGDTLNDESGNYIVSFDNICPLANEETYLVKSTYKKIDDLSAEVFGVDTIVVSRGSAAIPVLQVQDACPGTANGSITITAPAGVRFSYSINATNFQSASQFINLVPGQYVIAVLDNQTGCIYETVAQVNTNYSVNTTIAYPRDIYCTGESLMLSPVIDGITGGTFTADIPGLDMNAGTGVINTATSDTGYYTITYHINTTDSCINPVSTTSVRILADTQFVWTGAIDNTWENAGNWSCNNLPSAAANVFISSGSVVVNSNVTINSLTVSTGASVVINSGFNLTVQHP